MKAAYLAFTLCNAVPFGTTVIHPISGALPSAEGLAEVLKHTQVDCGLLVPSILQELGQRPDLVDFCAKHLDIIFYAGGDLPQAMGDAVASKIRVTNMFGASEVGIAAQLHPKAGRDPLDWKYIYWHPDAGYALKQSQTIPTSFV